ncbi:MAG: hypothetical protein MI747_15580 [Desulfobacterales bacterium]|nr:hypothetical protein [Desulfobacterales bacterium]
MSIAAELNKLLSNGVSGNQAELVEALKEQGIDTTQSSVSRALKKLNAVKKTDESGKSVYVLAHTVSGLKNIGFFDSLVTRILENGQMIVIHTRPGTANTVAKFIDDHGFDLVMGSIAGDDTIFIAPMDVERIKETLRTLTSYMKQIGIYTP